MNKVILMGRLTRDPEMRQTASGLPVASFSLAVDRSYKGQDGERKTDFINIVAWRQRAEFASRYFFKGMRVAVVGSMQTRSWEDQQGQKRYATEVVADELHFADSKRDGGGGGGQSYDQSPTKFSSQARDDDEFLSDSDEDMPLPFDL